MRRLKRNNKMKTTLFIIMLTGFMVAQEVNVDSLLSVKMTELQVRWETYETEQAKILYTHGEFVKFQESLKPKEVEAEDE